MGEGQKLDPIMPPLGATVGGEGKGWGAAYTAGCSELPLRPYPDLGQVALPLGGIVFSFVQQDDISLEG